MFLLWLYNLWNKLLHRKPESLMAAIESLDEDEQQELLDTLEKHQKKRDLK